MIAGVRLHTGKEIAIAHAARPSGENPGGEEAVRLACHDLLRMTKKQFDNQFVGMSIRAAQEPRWL